MYLSAHDKQKQEFLDSVNSNYFAMPLPRRWGMPSIFGCALKDYAPAYPIIDKLAQNERPLLEFFEEINNHPEIIHDLRGRSADLGQLNFLYIARRHQLIKAPIFTASKGLNLMLKDTGVKNDIPAKFLCPPFKTCFIEFEPFETRLEKINAGDPMEKYPEGCYIQETVCENLHTARGDGERYRAMGLDMNKPTRVLNILFSYAPSKNPVTGRYIAEGHYATFTVHIQDENASLTKLVSDQIDYLMTQQIKLDVNKDGVKKTADHLKAMMVNLSKMLLYLNLNLRDQVVEKAAEALDRKLVDANPKKRAKIERQAARVYDRIIVGPKSYTPISERFQDGEYGQGRKKPHFRRGTFGIRWKGPVGDQLPELVRISESIVNKDLMVDGSALNYELR